MIFLDIKLVKIEFDVYKLIDKIEAYTIDTISKFEISRVQKRTEELEQFNRQIEEEYRILDHKLKQEKLLVDVVTDVFKKLAPDAAALWVLSSSKFTRGLEYIEKNGEIVDKISDLKNEDLQKVVRGKLNSQLGKNESRGVYFYSNSSLSKSISSSYEFKKIINKHKDTLINQKKVVTKESVFLELNLNNWLAIHGCDILNIRVDNGVLRATVVDTWDFNKNDKKVEIPRELQDAGVIENYFTIVEIAEPIEKYYSL